MGTLEALAAVVEGRSGAGRAAVGQRGGAAWWHAVSSCACPQSERPAADPISPRYARCTWEGAGVPLPGCLTRCRQGRAGCGPVERGWSAEAGAARNWGRTLRAYVRGAVENRRRKCVGRGTGTAAAPGPAWCPRQYCGLSDLSDSRASRLPHLPAPTLQPAACQGPSKPQDWGETLPTTHLPNHRQWLPPPNHRPDRVPCWAAQRAALGDPHGQAAQLPSLPKLCLRCWRPGCQGHSQECCKADAGRGRTC